MKQDKLKKNVIVKVVIIKENGHFLGIEGDLYYFYPSFSNINKAIFIVFGL